MLRAIERDHRGRSSFFYLDVSIEETLRHHATRTQASEFGPGEMRDWYRPRDPLTTVRERVIPLSGSVVPSLTPRLRCIRGAGAEC
ncbi:MAG TPA: hypothetical protein VMC03_20715 [Streptosporangiaceae bacterium]|nr:hypothetical protein [Streptosporangiaceae bacterium]